MQLSNEVLPCSTTVGLLSNLVNGWFHLQGSPTSFLNTSYLVLELKRKLKRWAVGLHLRQENVARGVTRMEPLGVAAKKGLTLSLHSSFGGGSGGFRSGDANPLQLALPPPGRT